MSSLGSLSSLGLMGVSMAPGAMLLTVMPSGASSIARLRIIIFSPPFDMQ